jgi:hypothetical protein
MPSVARHLQAEKVTVVVPPACPRGRRRLARVGQVLEPRVNPEPSSRKKPLLLAQEEPYIWV